MLTLKQGDTLVKQTAEIENLYGFENVKTRQSTTVLAVCGELVAISLNENELSWFKIKDIEKAGWQLKKTRWVPKDKEKYFCVGQGGQIMQAVMLENNEGDIYRLSIGNFFETKEQAEAYRSELIERGKLNV